MSDVSLCSPLRLGPYALSHRVVMAPVTRMRAQNRVTCWELSTTRSGPVLAGF